MYPRHRLDVSVADLVWTLGRCLLPAPRVRAGGGLVLFSVRSAWELLLETLALPPGSEVLVTAVTHPDMARIARAHRLRVVPVDIDLDTLGPRPEDVGRAVTTRSRILLVAHLFGGEVDLGPLAEVARRHSLLVVEDRAQAFDGELRGQDDAGVSLFSFGTLKTATALGGAVALVGDADLAERMRALEAGWPAQPRARYAAKVLRVLALAIASRPALFGWLVTAGRRFRVDVDRLLSESMRGFPAGDEAFRAAIRRRPSAPLRALLARRLARVDRDRIARRRANGERLAVDLERMVRVPGRRALRRTHWLFPVMAEAPAELVALLRRAGFDAAQRTSAIAAIADEGGAAPPNAAELVARVVFLPAYPELPPGELRRLVRVVGGMAHAAAARARALT